MCFRNLPVQMTILGAMLFLAPAFAQDRRVAIYDFESRTAEVNLRRTVPQAINLGHLAAGQIMIRLVNSNAHIEVIERAEIERILKEQGRKYDERFDPSSAPELGRLLNVDGIVMGDVDSATATMQGSVHKIPGTKTVIGGRQAKATVHISARLISTQTGSIQVAETAGGDGVVSVSSSVSGVGNSSGSDDHTALQDAVSKAIEKAIGNVSNSIIGKAATLPKIQRSGAPVSSGNSPGSGQAGERVPIVNTIDGAKLYIEGGQDLKLSVGDRYDVRQVTKVLQLSNGTKSEIRERVETIVIDDVQPALSIAHVEGAQTSRAKPGDTLQKSTSLPPILQAQPGGGGVSPRKTPGAKFAPSPRGQQ
jgi:hypothetical protein